MVSEEPFQLNYSVLTARPELHWSLCLWRCTDPNWTQSWLSSCSWPCPSWGLDSGSQEGIPSNLSTSVIHWKFQKSARNATFLKKHPQELTILSHPPLTTFPQPQHLPAQLQHSQTALEKKKSMFSFPLITVEVAALKARSKAHSNVYMLFL